MKNQMFSVIIEKDATGYLAFCPELQGCSTQAETYEEVIDDITEAIRQHVEGVTVYNEDIVLH
ncbi:MAG: type II toxin-antitoxin system HicB family antitoxin [Desulfotomaculum sp.]|nr:type II toxin-antitoxin system HicB family antitoxin [Desulfotomaculum sp.]MCL0081310.1 type II toxin-antitoxin system HicB family antitoxin [Peptococcaceae bacterium]